MGAFLILPGRWLRRPEEAGATKVLGRLTFGSPPYEERRDFFRVLRPEDQPLASQDLDGYAAILVESADGPGSWDRRIAETSAPVAAFRSLAELEAGDVVALEPSGTLRRLYHRSSRHNAIFATERCNSYCLMCSQPPRDVDDRARIHEHLRLVELIDPETPELGVTGGEPTLLKGGLIELVAKCRDLLPRTALHILSNGRLFYYGSFARALGELRHPDLMVGVPFYSDLDAEHDHVVQARGAFDQALVGVQNLHRWGVPVEIRVVIHRLNVGRLLPLMEFLYRNLTFAAHVALMGLEPIGFALANRDALWVDPYDYRDELAEAALWLGARGMPVSIYNHPLCLLPREVWRFSRQSISDWKNQFLEPCGNCAVRERCAGFFASAVRQHHSAYVRPFLAAL